MNINPFSTSLREVFNYLYDTDGFMASNNTSLNLCVTCHFCQALSC